MKTDSKITTVALVNKQLIINLASADFLMGVYLISLGTMDEIQVPNLFSLLYQLIISLVLLSIISE